MTDSKTPMRFAKDQLKAFVERIERMEEERKAISDDIRDIYAEAKANGFDTKALRRVIQLRKQDANERAEFEAILDTYLHALGMLPGDPDPVGAANKHFARANEKSERKASGGVRRAAKELTDALGKPVEPTEEEKAKGVVAAFEKDGTRSSIGFPERKAM